MQADIVQWETEVSAKCAHSALQNAITCKGFVFCQVRKLGIFPKQLNLIGSAYAL